MNMSNVDKTNVDVNVLNDMWPTVFGSVSSTMPAAAIVAKNEANQYADTIWGLNTNCRSHCDQIAKATIETITVRARSSVFVSRNEFWSKYELKNFVIANSSRLPFAERWGSARLVDLLWFHFVFEFGFRSLLLIVTVSIIAASEILVAAEKSLALSITRFDSALD